MMTTFLAYFYYNDLTAEVWNQLSTRLQQEILNTREERKERYYGYNIPLLYETNKWFEGIFNLIQRNRNIKEAIDITSSEILKIDYPINALNYSDDTKYFRTKNIKNSFIYFDFKDHSIIPLNYTIKTAKYNCTRPKNWVIQ